MKGFPASRGLFSMKTRVKLYFLNQKSADIELDSKIGWLVGLLRTFFVFFKHLEILI
jgi:hypothetical protein